MVKDYNVRIDDNGAAFLVVINKGTSERLVVGAFSTLRDAWDHIKWMYQIEQQEFTVGKKEVPVKDWIAGMKMCVYID